jgi:hypothetical protein
MNGQCEVCDSLRRQVEAARLAKYECADLEPTPENLEAAKKAYRKWEHIFREQAAHTLRCKGAYGVTRSPG